MEDNQEVFETEETAESLAEAVLDAFDEDWDDDSDGEDVDTDDGQNDVATEEEGQADEGSEAEEAEPSDSAEEESESGNQRFKINYLGKEEELTLEQMTELAQKGRDYDHVRQERDSLKSESGKAMAFLKKLADKAGVSVEDQIDLTEAMWLMDEEAEKGNTITEAEALLRVQKGRNAAPKEEQEKPEESDKPVVNPQVARFMKAYPNVAATDIPKEVWEAMQEMDGDLLGAYQAWEIKQLKAENAKHRQEDKNNRNKARSTGPLKSTGSNRQKDDFDAAWDSDDD